MESVMRCATYGTPKPRSMAAIRVRHLTGGQGVAGSNPVSPTKPPTRSFSSSGLLSFLVTPGCFRSLTRMESSPLLCLDVIRPFVRDGSRGSNSSDLVNQNLRTAKPRHAVRLRNLAWLVRAEGRSDEVLPFYSSDASHGATPALQELVKFVPAFSFAHHQPRASANVQMH